MYKVYCHVFPNGKKYVGITKSSLERRWNKGNGYGTCTLVNRAIKKYGWENVKHVVLQECELQEDAETYERYYIEEYKTNNPMFGYNILPGGDVSNNVATPEMRYKLGNGNRGKRHSKEEKEAIGNGVKQVFKRPESNGHYGMIHSEETKEKMSNTHKKQYIENPELIEKASKRMKARMSDDDYRKRTLDRIRKAHMRPVAQLSMTGELIKIWESAQAAEDAGIADHRHISDCCRHRPGRKSTKGYRWEYVEKK